MVTMELLQFLEVQEIPKIGLLSKTFNLKIDINKHRQLIEQAQPTVKEGLDQLKKESGINDDESVEIEDPEKESTYAHINEETTFEKSQQTLIKKPSGESSQGTRNKPSRSIC